MSDVVSNEEKAMRRIHKLADKKWTKKVKLEAKANWLEYARGHRCDTSPTLWPPITEMIQEYRKRAEKLRVESKKLYAVLNAMKRERLKRNKNENRRRA